MRQIADSGEHDESGTRAAFLKAKTKTAGSYIMTAS